MTGIVVGVDGSEGGAAALLWAIREGDRHDPAVFHSSCPVVVVPPDPGGQGR